MASKLNIASIPLKIAWADREENLLRVSALMRHLRRGTDIVVLPELFATGYVQDPDAIAGLAEPADGPTITTMRRLAAKYNTAICGTFICREGEALYNRAFFIEPSGDTTWYDKRHLFSLSSEHELFTPGHTLPPSVRFRGWDISFIVCYDLRFPVWCRRRRNDNYDLLLVPANWPQSRGFAWQQLLSARAIENQAVCVGCNRGGSDDFGDYDNLSQICDALGKRIDTVDSATGILYATPDREELLTLRRKLPFGNDADFFSVQ